MAKTVDLNKLKDEIASRKSERNIVPSSLGESVGAGSAPRDEFLNGLLVSLKTGKSTAATNLIKLVENKTAVKNRESAIHTIDTDTIARPVQQAPAPRRLAEEIDMSPERDEQLFRDLENKRKQTLSEQIQGYTNIPSVGAPMQNRPPQAPMQLNEAYLTENVQKIVNNYLIENFGPVLEEAIKGTLLELYAVDRIKEVMTGNKEIIKSIVVETIREIQANSIKKKAQ